MRLVKWGPGFVAGLVLVCLSPVPATPASEATTILPVRGIVRPVNQASIATDLALPVSEIHFREAEAFRKGDVLVAFDCAKLEAQYSAADAVYREMQLSLNSNVYLDRRGAVGKMDVEISRARLDKANADAQALKAQIEQCKIVAPFDGRVTELSINEHEIPGPSRPFISIVDESIFEIDLIVPSQWLRRLAPDSTFSFTIDETQKTYGAKVLRTGAAVDPVSQTVKVIAGFTGKDELVISGMSGTAIFPDLEASQ